jgi:hypothetical protein
VNGPASIAEAVPARRSARRASAVGWVRRRLATTPGRLELISVAVVVGAVSFGLVAGAAERSRDRAAQAARTATEPLLVQAVTLYTSLSDAEATATTTFLTGGLEPAARRARYLNDVKVASGSLSALTRELGNSPATRAAVTTVADQLPVYSGLVESARANNRQGFPVGAAYLRQASQLLATSILPAADHLYRTEAGRLDNDYGSGTATAALVTFAVVVVALLLLLLLLVQWYLAFITHRVINVPMLAASVAVLVVSVWGLAGLIAEQSSLADAQHKGSDPVEVLSATRILVSRAQSDESLTLVNRGSDQKYLGDFDAVMRALAPGGPLLAGVTSAVGGQGATGAGRGLALTFAAYRAQHAQIDRLARQGNIPDAIRVAVGVAAGNSSPSVRLSTDLESQIQAAQNRFARSASDATSALTGLSVGGAVLTVLAAGLTLLGLRRRINEYR